MGLSRYLTFVSLASNLTLAAGSVPVLAASAPRKNVTAPSKLDPRLVKAIELFDHKKYAEAAASLKAFRATGKVEARRQFQLARALSKLGDQPGAIRASQEAYRLDPGIINALYNIACYASLNRNFPLVKESLEALSKRIDTRLDRKRMAAFYAEAIEADADFNILRTTDSQLYDSMVRIFNAKFGGEPVKSAGFDPEWDGGCAACGDG